MNSICWIFEMRWHDMSGLSMCLSCTSWWIRERTPRVKANADPHSGLVAAFLQTLCVMVTFSCCLHWKPCKTNVFFFVFYITLITIQVFVVFQCRPLTSSSLPGATLLFSAMMSHAMPWHCDVVHPTQSTARAYSEVIDHSQQASSDGRQ